MTKADAVDASAGRRGGRRSPGAVGPDEPPQRADRRRIRGDRSRPRRRPSGAPRAAGSRRPARGGGAGLRASARDRPGVRRSRPRDRGDRQPPRRADRRRRPASACPRRPDRSRSRPPGPQPGRRELCRRPDRDQPHGRGLDANPARCGPDGGPGGRRNGPDPRCAPSGRGACIRVRDRGPAGGWRTSPGSCRHGSRGGDRRTLRPRVRRAAGWRADRDPAPGRADRRRSRRRPGRPKTLARCDARRRSRPGRRPAAGHLAAPIDTGPARGADRGTRPQRGVARGPTGAAWCGRDAVLAPGPGCRGMAGRPCRRRRRAVA